MLRSQGETVNNRSVFVLPHKRNGGGVGKLLRHWGWDRTSGPNLGAEPLLEIREALSGEQFTSVSCLKMGLHHFNDLALKHHYDDTQLTRSLKDGFLNRSNENDQASCLTRLLSLTLGSKKRKVTAELERLEAEEASRAAKREKKQEKNCFSDKLRVH